MSARKHQQKKPSANLIDMILACNCGNEVKCPTCGFEYMHPIEVQVDRGGSVVQVDADGVGFLKREPQGRGVVIVVKFHCEDGYESFFALNFHKGVTFSHMIAGKALPSGENDGLEIGDVIWRD